jgi:hypothetical protein
MVEFCLDVPPRQKPINHFHKPNILELLFLDHKVFTTKKHPTQNMGQNNSVTPQIFDNGGALYDYTHGFMSIKFVAQTNSVKRLAIKHPNTNVEIILIVEPNTVAVIEFGWNSNVIVKRCTRQKVLLAKWKFSPECGVQCLTIPKPQTDMHIDPPM